MNLQKLIIQINQSISLFFQYFFKIFQTLNSFLRNGVFNKVRNISSWIHVCKVCDFCRIVINLLENPSTDIHHSHHIFWIWLNWIIAWFYSQIKLVSFVDPCGHTDWLSVIKWKRCFHYQMKDFVFVFFFMDKYILKNIIIEFFHIIVFHEETDNFL